MSAILYYQNKLYFRCSIALAIFAMLMTIAATVFIIYTKLHIIGFFLTIPSLVFIIKFHSATSYSIDTQRTMSVFGINLSIKKFISTFFIEVSSLPLAICTLTVSVYEPKSAPIFIGYLIAMLSVTSSICIIMKRLPLSFIAYMVFTLPLTMFASFYAGSSRSVLVQANDFLSSRQHSMGMAMICIALIAIPLSALLIKRVKMRRLFCSPEVVAKNMGMK